jgi:uncharacterized RDD family membrane protein YckC
MSTQWESAPQAPPGAYSSGPSGPRAGFWIRFGAYLLDGLIVGIPAAILVVICALISSSLAVLAYIVVLVGAVAYYVYFSGGPKGATYGKQICGIKIIDFNNGGPIGYGRAFIRFLMQIVSGWIFYLGYLWMLWDKEKQCWHDKVANDVVVPADAYRQ